MSLNSPLPHVQFSTLHLKTLSNRAHPVFGSWVKQWSYQPVPKQCAAWVLLTIDRTSGSLLLDSVHCPLQSPAASGRTKEETMNATAVERVAPVKTESASVEHLILPPSIGVWVKWGLIAVVDRQTSGSADTHIKGDAGSGGGAARRSTESNQRAHREMLPAIRARRCTGCAKGFVSSCPLQSGCAVR